MFRYFGYEEIETIEGLDMQACINCGEAISDDEVVYCYDCGRPLCEDGDSIGLCSSCEA